MNIDFNAAFEGGMTKEDIQEMMERQLAQAENEYNERKAAEEAARKEAELKAQQSKEKEALKAEGRAYLINALIAYSEAFDLLDEGETWSEKDVAKAEEAIKKFEEMLPVYVKLIEMQNELGREGIDPNSFFKGLF